MDCRAWSLRSALALAACNGDESSGGTETDTDTEGSSAADDFGDEFDVDDFNDEFDVDDFPDDGDDFPDDGVDPDTTTTASVTDTGTVGATSNATTSGSDTGVVETDGGPDDGDCCQAHKEGGCEVERVETCVCMEDPFCCDNAWDPICTVLVVTENCGTCSNIGGDGDCCMANNGSPGCDDDKVEACVCAMDVACCLMEWDELCVAAVENGCGQC